MDLTTDEKRPLLDVSNIRHSSAWQRRRILRNAAILNLSALLGFCGGIGLSGIQSSLNSDQGIGVISMAVGASSAMLGGLLSSAFIGMLGCKTTIALSQVLATLALVSNFYPTWATMIPSSIVGGISGATTAVAHRVYTANLGHLYSDTSESGVTSRTRDVNRSLVQGRFFLFYVAAFKLTNTLGNLAASLILGTGFDTAGANSSLALWSNSSTTGAPPPQCGAAYCNEDLGSDFHDASDRSRIYGLIGFGVGTSFLAAVLVFCFLDDLSNLSQSLRSDDPNASQPAPSLSSMWQTFCKTMTLYKNPRLLLVVPTALSLFAIDSFWGADFTKAFITCPLGMENIGFVMLWVGISGMAASLCFGWMSSHRLRLGPLLLAPLLHIALAIGLLYWEPGDDSMVALSAYTIAWYIGAGARHALIPALVGIVFRDELEPAFSNIYVWGAIGSVVVYLWSSLLCMDVKIYLIVSMLVLATITYVALELLLETDRIRAQSKSRLTNNDHESNNNECKD